MKYGESIEKLVETVTVSEPALTAERQRPTGDNPMESWNSNGSSEGAWADPLTPPELM
jgi:hypothetical protein